MAILLFITSDRIKKEPYDKVFADHGPVFYGVHDEKKNFFMDDNSSIDIDNKADYLHAKSLLK